MTATTHLTGRRAELAAAAVGVVASGGLRGLTHRAVDAAAGVPDGTTSAYLRTRAALLSALGEYVAGGVLTDVRGLTARLGPESTDAEVVAATTDLMRAWIRRPDVLLVRAELTLESLRTPELLALFAPWRAELVDLVAGVACAKGIGDAPRRAAAVVSALEGICSGALLQPEARRSAYVGEMVATVLGALIDHD